MMQNLELRGQGSKKVPQCIVSGDDVFGQVVPGIMKSAQAITKAG